MSPIKWVEVYEVVDVSELPIPQELKEPPCMVGAWVWLRRRLRRLAPWLVPSQAPRECCWHHRVDWRWTAGTAVRLVREAQAAGIEGEEIDEYVTIALDDEEIGLGQMLAVSALVGSGCGIQLSDPDASWLYQDGQHRVAAQIDQGVRQTIIQRYDPIDPDTGQPVAD
jgi:hypothetical protein